MINLVDNLFQNSALFAHLPIFDEIYYEGVREGKVQKYRAIREGQECILLGLTVIRKDEDFLWTSCEDFLEKTVRDAAGRVHGIYSFDLLTFHIHKEVKTFNYNELQYMIVTNSRKLAPGQERLIKYSSAYGILRKLVHEEWGKITLKTAVDVFKQQPSNLDVLVRQLLKDADFSHKPLIALIHDLSSNPLFDPADGRQQKLLKAAVNKYAVDAIDFPPEVYVQDKNGVRELLSGTEVV